jgi:hypothetical protein
MTKQCDYPVHHNGGCIIKGDSILMSNKSTIGNCAVKRSLFASNNRLALDCPILLWFVRVALKLRVIRERNKNESL